MLNRRMQMSRKLVVGGKLNAEGKREYANSRPLPCCVAFCSQPVPRVCWREFEAVGKRRGGEGSGRIRFESRPPRPQSDVNSREDALKAYRRTRLKLLAWAPNDEDRN